jgi:hypothetical protein
MIMISSSLLYYVQCIIAALVCKYMPSETQSEKEEIEITPGGFLSNSIGTDRYGFGMHDENNELIVVEQ